jgi:hypothetical protein
MSLKFTGLNEMQRSYSRAASVVGKAEARAVRRVGVSIRAEQSRAIRELLNVRAHVVRDAIQVKTQPTAEKPRVVFEVRSKGIPLAAFNGVRQTRAGVSVAVIKGQPRSLLRAAFGVEKYGGNYFGRAGVGSKRYGSPHVGRLPIKKLYGPSVLSQYIKDAIQDRGVKVWESRLPVELERETSYALRSIGVL